MDLLRAHRKVIKKSLLVYYNFIRISQHKMKSFASSDGTAKSAVKAWLSLAAQAIWQN